MLSLFNPKAGTPARRSIGINNLYQFAKHVDSYRAGVRGYPVDSSYRVPDLVHPSALSIRSRGTFDRMPYGRVRYRKTYRRGGKTYGGGAQRKRRRFRLTGGRRTARKGFFRKQVRRHRVAERTRNMKTWLKSVSKDVAQNDMLEIANDLAVEFEVLGSTIGIGFGTGSRMALETQVMYLEIRLHFEMPIARSGVGVKCRYLVVKKTNPILTSVPVLTSTAFLTDPNALYEDGDSITELSRRNRLSRRSWAIIKQGTLKMGEDSVLSGGRIVTHVDRVLHIPGFKIRWKDYSANSNDDMFTGALYFFAYFINTGESDAATTDIPEYSAKIRAWFSPLG